MKVRSTKTKAAVGAGTFFVATVASVTLGAPVAFADSFSQLECANTPIANVRVCIDRDNSNDIGMQGRFYNGSSSNIYNDGYFQYQSDGTIALNCGSSTTAAHTQSSCEASFPSSRWGDEVRVCDQYYYNGSYATKCTGYYTDYTPRF